jgi:cyanate permease
VIKEDPIPQTREDVSQECSPNVNEICMTARSSFAKDDGSDSSAQNLSRRDSIAFNENKLDSSKIAESPKDESNIGYVEPKRDDAHSRSLAKTSEKLEKTKNTHFFDLSVLRDPVYLVILISNSTSAISNTNFMILLPSYAIAEGFDKNSSALLLSIVSALDVVGRISGASLSDIDFMPKYYYFVGGLGTSGIALALLPMATSYTTLSFFCGLFGLSSGMYIGITTVILADMLGTEKLSSSYGISLFINGVLQLVGPPICGVIFENVLSYKPIFLAFGIILILGTALWGAVPIINRKNKKDVEAM